MVREVPVSFGKTGTKTPSDVFSELLSAQIIGVDTETHTVADKRLIGLAIAPCPDYAIWFPKGSPYMDMALAKLRDPLVTKVFHNSKFDYDVLELEFGLQIDRKNFEDSEILAYTLNLPQKLYRLASHLGKVIEDRFFSWSMPEKQTMADQPYDFVLEKCCTDAALTLWCWYKLLPSKVRSYEIDRDVVHILRHMELAGMRIDQPCLLDFYDEVSSQASYLRQLIQTKGCDPSSNQQVGIALAQKGWRLPYTKSRKQLKVNEATISEIDDPLAQAVLLYREKAKLLSTYIKPLLGLDRVYGKYNNTRVITGRLSSSDPNMQNIPEYFRIVLMADNYLFDLDANQIELRVIAWQSQDPIMLAIYMNGGDIHAETMRLLGLTDRKLAKTLNFATVYGGEAEIIIEQARKWGIRLSMMQAMEFQSRYFLVYRRLAEYIREMKNQILRNGYVTTMFGRVRKADPLAFTDTRSLEKTMKELINMPTQGSAAEIIKIMMTRAKNYDLRIQVHDELVYDGACPPPSICENIVPFPTPLDLKVGTHWGDLMKVGYN